MSRGKLFAFFSDLRYNDKNNKKQETAMNKLLLISAMQYDFHTLLKVADICGFTGEIGFHDAEDGYLLTFPDNDGHADRRIAEYRSRLRDLEHNIWNR